MSECGLCRFFEELNPNENGLCKRESPQVRNITAEEIDEFQKYYKIPWRGGYSQTVWPEVSNITKCCGDFKSGSDPYDI